MSYVQPQQQKATWSQWTLYINSVEVQIRFGLRQRIAVVPRVSVHGGEV